MNSKAKKLQKENNKLEKKLNAENNESYTNIIVYLRGADMTEYNQEKVRADIIQMLIEGQDRGDTIEQVIGDDYKSFCDAITEEMPKRTRKQKTIEHICLAVSMVAILLGIQCVNNVITHLIKQQDPFEYVLTLGNVCSGLIIIICAFIIVDLTIKRAFLEPIIKNKVAQFFVLWLICMMIIGAMIGIDMLLRSFFITMSVFIPVIVVIVCVGLHKWLEEQIDA